MNLIKYYDQQKYYKINRFRKEALLSLIPGEAVKILDLGCGEGILGEIVKKNKSIIYHGADISLAALAIAEKKLDKVFNFNFEENFDIWPENLKTEKYDLIILSEVLEHLFFPEKFLSNLKNLLKPRGEIVITVPNVLFWKNRLKIFFGNFNYTAQGIMDRGHIHFFTWNSLIYLTEVQGFSLIKVNNYAPTRGTKILCRMFPGLFSFQFIIKIKLNLNNFQ